MKKIINKVVTVLLLVLAVIISIPKEALADTFSKYAASRNEYTTTSEGIDVKYDKENHKIIYTLTEEFDGKEAYFNVTEDMKNILETVYMPGDDAAFQIEVVNESKYEYHYLKNSLTVDTLNFNDEFASDSMTMGENIWYSYTANGENGKYIKDAIAFDGSILPASYTISRTANRAIKALLMNSENNENGKYLGCNINSITNNDACRVALSDEILGEELKAQGYTNGIADLNKYYLDYYNNASKTSVEKLEDLPQNAILGIFGGNRMTIKETNPEVSTLGYNWFYNECLYLAPSSDSEGNAINLDSTYTIGAYMRGENTVFEDVFAKDFATISSDSTMDLRTFEMYLDGPKTVNVFMDMNLGYMMSFSLEREALGTVVINYVDSDGNKLTEEVTTTDLVGNEYFTEKKNFEGYTFIMVEGPASGEYIDGTIYVTYYYDKNTGTGDIMPPQTGFEPSTINNTRVEVINLYKKDEE